MKEEDIKFSINFKSFLLFVLTLFFSYFVSAADSKICKNIIIKGGHISLNKNEKVLICGSDDGPEGWQEIPLLQAEIQLKAVLQNAGYLNPKIQAQSGVLNVWLGQQTKITKLEVTGAQGVLDPRKKRNVVGEALTPDKLDEVKAWANLKTKTNGYACPDLNVEAFGWNGNVFVKANLGEKNQIGKLSISGLDGLSPHVLDRYKAFEEGDFYNIEKTSLTTDRMLSSGLFQSAFIETDCSKNDVALFLKTSVAKPRIIRFGIGASTEDLVFMNLSFRNARLDDEASSFTANLQVSQRLLSLAVDSELYWFPNWHKIFLSPRFEIARENEPSYQSDSSRTGMDLGYRWDVWSTRLLGKIGPTYNTVETTRGIGPTAEYPTLDASLTAKSHTYEFLYAQQYAGWEGRFSYRGHSKGLSSEADVSRYDTRYKYLWNIGQYAPPLFVLSTRLQGTFVDAIEPIDEESTAKIPIADRIFVGGDNNLRGFPRQSISNDGKGYLSFLYSGFELRLVEELPYNLQPFLLFDIGKVGLQRYTLDATTFTSEGIGLRWLSPLGTIRGSLARGRVQNEQALGATFPERLMLFLSFGKEF